MATQIQNDKDTEILQIPGAGSIKFSAIRPDDLGATEYTLVTILVDVTGSVSPFVNDLLKAVKSIVEACKKSPRAENLLIRLVAFNYNNNIVELHGFKLLSLIDPNNYTLPNCQGMTGLFDATYEAISATLTYSKSLIDQDFNCNGAVYIITDGCDNDSVVASPASIKFLLDSVMKDEIIESLITILVGINASEHKSSLESFQKEAGITQFVDAGDATPQRLAKLAAFVSKSISSTSQALGTGSASQPFTF